MICWRWLLILLLCASGCGYLVGYRHCEIVSEGKFVAPIPSEFNEPFDEEIQ